MKALTEKQIEIINDFENYKKTLRTKYYEMQKSMQMLAGTIEQPSEKVNDLIAVVQSCQNSLDDWSPHVSISINEVNVLVIKEISKELTPVNDNEKKNKAIRGLLNVMSNFSYATGELINFVKENEDFRTLHREKNMLQSHIEKVIEIILDQ